MVLMIDTTCGEEIKVSLVGQGVNFSKKILAPRKQAEKLLPFIVKILNHQKIDWRQIEEIKVQNNGGSFTSLRIGVLTANALAYALGVPVNPVDNQAVAVFSGIKVVKPCYQSEPNIGRAKNPTC